MGFEGGVLLAEDDAFAVKTKIKYRCKYLHA
jgi:hypothetical protein